MIGKHDKIRKKFKKDMERLKGSNVILEYPDSQVEGILKDYLIVEDNKFFHFFYMTVEMNGDEVMKIGTPTAIRKTQSKRENSSIPNNV